MSDTQVINVSRDELFIKSIVTFNQNIEKSVENNNISKSVKQLLSSFQSISKKFCANKKFVSLLSDQIFAKKFAKCLKTLEDIVLFENSFAETSVLSGLAIAYALNIYLCDTERAIDLYSKLFLNQSISSENLSQHKVVLNLSDILTNSDTNNDLTKVSLLSGLLNCSHFIDYLMEFESKLFVQIHRNIIKICEKSLIHEFYVFKLLQQWFKTFKDHIKQLAVKDPNIFDDKTVINDTLFHIDNCWEHPINGVKDCIKIIYVLVLETFTTFKNLVANSYENCRIKSYDLITEEVVKCSRLSLNSKAKYRKTSALIPLIGWKTVLETDPNMSSQMLKYVSINSLSTAIIELYKTIVISMKMERNEHILDVWSKHFLESMCCALKSKNKVIHNNLTAHLLPFTLKNVDNSTQLIFDNLNDSRLASVALVRAAVDHNLMIDFWPSLKWFTSILINSEDMVREEGLSLLIDERYITDRDKVFELFKLFLISNLNVDNPSFRQKMISKLDKFLTKICISLGDKFSLHRFYDESDQKAVQFLKDYTNTIVSNLISGASFQRRTTSLLLLDCLLTNTSKNNLNFNEFIDLNETYFLLILSVIDKDDKIRKIASNLLIRFDKSYINSIDYDFNTIANIALNFLNSPRHQESHSGGLLMKYIINCFKTFKINETIISNELQLIEYFVRSAESQLKSSKTNLLVAAKSYPIHGFILALNNCLSIDILKKFAKQNQFKQIINESIELCFDCTHFMLGQLSNSRVESSPSFQEMFESLETVINQQMIGSEDNCDDISTSNEFQLLLSMCWLNIKECSFLLSNCLQLSLHFDHQIITDSTVLKIGSQLITILSKCRHKGVIEATSIALTSYTVSLIKAKTRSAQHILTLNQILMESLNCLTKSSLTSSITRRSAGVALTIQAILSGESEAFSDGFKLEKSLFSQTIDKLIETSNSEIPQNMDITNDLPQTYALHILNSIVSTASLSCFTVKITELLLPICIKGFSSQVWQIRNASLQLFGSCCCRMLGQRKTSDVDHSLTEGSTITSNEFFSRYPTLFEAFKTQFDESFKKMEIGFFCTELVPVLSLLAYFSPICLGEPFTDEKVLKYLIRLLGNRIWKIRMLSAKALTTLLPINQLQQLLLQLVSHKNLNSNSIHGLMLSVNHLLELKFQNKDNDYHEIKNQFTKAFEEFVKNNKNCFILSNVFNELFDDNSPVIDYCGQEIDENQDLMKFHETDHCLTEFLDDIYSRVEFTKSDDIRLLAAKSLYNCLDQILPQINSPNDIFKIVDILLVILVDEDRTVRTEAERIVSKVIDSNGEEDPIIFNVAIDNLLIWLNGNPLISPQKLTEFYFNKLESFLSISELVESRHQNSEVLFEREEKNVFAEPLLLMFKIGVSLQKVISNKSTKINEKSLEKLLKDCDYFLENLSLIDIESMVSFSIWKLPKLFICLNSLYLRTDVLFQSILRDFDETKISSIITSLDELKISEYSQKTFAQNINISDDMLKPEVMQIMSRTHRLLSTKFKFLCFLKQNSLFGFSLTNFDLN